MEDQEFGLRRKELAINTALRKLLSGSGVYASITDGMYTDVMKLIEDARVIEKYLKEE